MFPRRLQLCPIRLRHPAVARSATFQDFDELLESRYRKTLGGTLAASLQTAKNRDDIAGILQ
jgi:hypothetical protein